jgi:hypothetical protein
MELAGNCRMNNKQRRSAMTETDITAPMNGAIQGSTGRALPDMETNPKGGE